jgi:hypothetical protein
LIKQLFGLVHATLREEFIGFDEWSVGNSQFVSTDPATWPVRNRIRLTVGMSSSQRNQMRNVLGEHLLQQEKLNGAGLGGVLVSMDTYYTALVAWSKAGGILSPRAMWVDPRTPEAQQALEQKRAEAEQAAQKQTALEERLFSTQVLIKDRENQSELVKHFTTLRFDYWDAVLKSEMEEMRVKAQGAEDATPDPVEIDADQDKGREQANAKAGVA